MQKIQEWFEQEKRDLPWRNNPTPYAVWISEIMLQQTQVLVVLPYFERWMQAFPTVEVLAHASLEQVIKNWEGLGYYSRARNLHAAAKMIVEKFGGNLPQTKEELMQIKGIGPYTQGAILSFAFKQKAAAVDGNVTRVVSRLTGLEEQKKITAWVETNLPDHKPWVAMEGLIELGATLCKKKPDCLRCPLRQECYAYRHQCIDELPKKKERPKTTYLKRSVAIIVCKQHYLLTKVEQGVMQDLFQFPYLEGEGDVKKMFKMELALDLRYIKPLKKERHTFTRYHVELFPHLFETSKLDPRFLWKSKLELQKLPFSSGHKRILNSL